MVDTETLEVDSVPVLTNLNQMRLSPDGRWAVLYDTGPRAAAAVARAGSYCKGLPRASARRSTLYAAGYDGGTNHFEVTLYSDGKIKFQYKVSRTIIAELWATLLQ